MQKLGAKVNTMNGFNELCVIPPYYFNFATAFPILGKNESKKYYDQESTEFCSDWVFLRKIAENAPKFYIFGCFFFFQFLIDRPNFVEIPLDGNTAIFVFWGGFECILVILQ